MNPIRTVALFSLFVTLSAPADDWPQWRGPQRNGISRETGLLKEWPKEGPKLLWSVNDLGSGYGAPSVVGDHVYILANKGLKNEFVEARSVKDGAKVWSTPLGKVGNPDQNPSYPAARSTPTVEGDVLYALGSDGDLVCLERATGKVRWKKNLRIDFGGLHGEWAYSESPLIDGDALICTPGGGEATVLALNKRTGEVIWKCVTPEGDPAAYSSPIVVDFGGVRQYVQLLEKGLVGVEAKTGKLLWRYDKAVSPFRATIPTPVAADGYVFIGVAGKGAGAVKLKSTNGGIDVEEVYFQPNLPAAIGGSVKVGDNLFGTTARALLCLDFATGQIRWDAPSLGAASICYADQRLYLHGENGDVALVEASPQEYRERGRFTPPNRPPPLHRGEKAWAYPVVANGHLYIREHDMLWCYDIRAN